MYYYLVVIRASNNTMNYNTSIEKNTIMMMIVDVLTIPKEFAKYLDLGNSKALLFIVRILMARRVCHIEILYRNHNRLENY